MTQLSVLSKSLTVLFEY